MAARIWPGFRPVRSTSSAASPDTCGVAWLVPMKPLMNRSWGNALHTVSENVFVAGSNASDSLEHPDHTHETPMMLPCGSNEALPPGAATLIAERPTFV